MDSSQDVDKTGASSSSAQRLHQHKLEYDIFINHRGPDTKLNFVTHLQEALTEKQYTPFVDRSVEEGSLAFEEIEAAIKDTSVHVAIFSPRYAESKYCLDELVLMLECRQKNPRAVTLVPIFYEVKPQDLRRPDENGSPFCAAFRDKASRYSAEQISRWKKALHDAAGVKRFELSSFVGDTNELKMEIIRRVQEIIAPRNGLHRRQRMPRPNVGGKELMEATLKQLEEMGDNVAILGICGTGGIGKTTLAREIYSHYSASGGFLYLTFLKIGESEKVSHLQKQSLRELLNRKEKNLVEKYVGLFESLAGMKVLVVVDDISKTDHFKELVPNIKKLGAGSRIVLTSRRRDTLRAVMSEAPQIATHLHEMKELDHSDSFELFWFHAFQNKELSKQADDTFRPLAVKVVESCYGLPLALKIIGQHLFGKPEKVWKVATKSMRERPGIIDVLSISYKGLDTPSEKMMFLDVSCQMIGLLEEDAVDIWKSCESCRPALGCITSKMVHDSLQVLKDKYLVEVDKLDGRLTMHDLIKEMGRKMDGDDTHICTKNGQSPFHLWDPLDAKAILDDGKGTKDIRGLSLVGLKRRFDAKAFNSMPNLHLLQLDGARIEGDFSQVSKKIRWLQWRSSPFTKLPQLELEHLAILDVSNSSSLVRLWSDSGTKVLKSLRVLLLQNCIALEEIPETIKFLTMLRTLNLQGCKSLKELPGTLSELRELEDLDFNECESLEGLPDGMVKLSNLKTFSMDGCIKIMQLPADFGELSGSLVTFSAQDATSLTCLPESFSRLSLLDELRLSNCPFFSEFPKSIKGLAKVRVIRVHATGLTHLPDDFGELPSLVELHLTRCNSLQSLPKSFGNLSLLKVLSLKKCKKFRMLSPTFGQLQSLTYLNLEECPIEDGDLPVNFGGLKRLTTLLMQENKMTTLPDSFRDLTALATLNMRESLDLVDVEALPPSMEELLLAGCPKIAGVNLVDKLSKLRKLILINCTRLTDIQGLESTENLNHINLSGCTSLSKVYENLLFKPTVKECYISGSKVCLKYNNDWSQVGAPSAQVISYYGHAIGFIGNTMARKICSVQDANELCVEAKISSTSVEAVVITVVAHDQGWSDYPHLHGEYNGSCNIEARIVRSEGEVPVFSSQLLALRHADRRDQVYVCTLRKSHPLIKRLKDGDRICVYARSIYRGWRITVMKGSIWVAYDRGSPRSDKFAEGLYLKDELKRSNLLPRVVQAATTFPVRVRSSGASDDGGPPLITQGMMRSVARSTFGTGNPTELDLYDCPLVDPNRVKLPDASIADMDMEDVADFCQSDTESDNASTVDTDMEDAADHNQSDGQRGTSMQCGMWNDCIVERCSDPEFMHTLEKKMEAMAWIQNIDIEEAFSEANRCDQSTVVLGTFNVANDNLEFYFESGESMAKLVGVGLLYGKVIVKRGIIFEVQEVEPKDWKKVWLGAKECSNKSLTIMKVSQPTRGFSELLKDGGRISSSPSSSTKQGFNGNTFAASNSVLEVPCIWELAKFFIMKQVNDVFQNGCNADVSRKSFGTNFKEDYPKDGNETIMTWAQTLKGLFSKGTREEGDKKVNKSQEEDQGGGSDRGNGDGNGGDDDSIGEDSKVDEEEYFTVVNVFLLSGGDCFERNMKPLSNRLPLSHERLRKARITPALTFGFCKSRKSKTIQVTTRAIFALNKDCDSIDTCGHFGWFHDEMHVSFGPFESSDQHIQQTAQLKIDFKEIESISGKMTTTASAARDTKEGKGKGCQVGMDFGSSQVARFRCGANTNQEVAITDHRSNEQSLESQINQTSGGFIIRAVPVIDKALLEYEYFAPFFEISADQIQNQGYRYELKIHPKCNLQNTGFVGTWIPIGDNEVVEYILKADRRLHEISARSEKQSASTSSGIMTEPEYSQVHVLEPPVMQVYQKQLFVNHAMGHLINGQTYTLVESDMPQNPSQDLVTFPVLVR